MRLIAVQRILGALLMAFSIFMLMPLGVSYLYSATAPADLLSIDFLLTGDGAARPFLLAFASIFLIGVALWAPVRKKAAGIDLKIRDGFLVVSAFWLGLGLAGSAPLLMMEQLEMSVTDAVFESISGLTTTGATVISGLDDLPKSILFYRQMLQWLGGMGIIVLAVAVLPMLGIGGMQLYRAETPGPVKDSKLTPRIAKTAKALWAIYLFITIACGLAYYAAGMDPFDAVAHSFSTVAIGGFSTHDASLGYFEHSAVEYVAIFFMLIAGVNFSLHFVAWSRIRLGVPLVMRGWRPAWRRTAGSLKLRHLFGGYGDDPEFRAYLQILFFLSLIAVTYLHFEGMYPSWVDALRDGVFQVVSIGTTTGFTTADFSLWHGPLPVLLIFASFIGGCAGSTGGGMKVIRWLLIVRQSNRELLRLLHPSAEIPVKLGGRAVPQRVMEAAWGFFSAYIAVFAVFMTILMFTGLDQVTAFSAVAASLNNLGPGLGEVASNYATISNPAKWVCVLAMVLGRLEIFTLLVLITPEFWRR